MSTGSAASDGEDFETLDGRRQRTGRKFGCYDPARFTDEELEEEEEEEEDGGMKQGRKVSKPAHKDARQSQRNAANARERARMRVLSKAFTRLKTTLPWVPADTKLSKLDTLRLASSYITYLRQLLQDDRFENSFAHPVSLTWPFMMTGRSEDTQDMSSSVRLCGATA
ncbi:transcription factor 21 [Genypterus blacodes]|uniref:transcription factor 21 n=1 Tax=Genypterus blacodes TaxID=154954 RepID=UPI003F776D40